MPILPPSLDDRAYDDLVAEVLARIPAHTPEWTNPQPGDPGRTLVELFAWLTDTLLYRANLIPERQRLAFLRLLGAPMQPAAAARGLVSIRPDDEDPTDVALAPLARLKGPVDFETLSELTVLPLSAEVYVKRPLTRDEGRDLNAVLAGLRQVYRLNQRSVGYVTTPVFPEGAAELAGVDLGRGTVDRSLWLGSLHEAPLASLAAEWLDLGTGDRLAEVCERTWEELAAAGRVAAASWHDEVAVRTRSQGPVPDARRAERCLA